MGSAPVRRPATTRWASSARRGAYVGNGMTGVRKVSQSRGSSAGLVSTAGGGGGTVHPDWTEIVNGWVWDAGTYLGADFEDMIGFPTDDGGSAQLKFLVLPPGSDSNVLVTNDPYSQEPNGTATLIGGVNDWFEIPDPSTPDADSHLWLYWHGPDSDPATDDPPTVAPASLVPAALASGGTA